MYVRAVGCSALTPRFAASSSRRRSSAARRSASACSFRRCAFAATAAASTFRFCAKKGATSAGATPVDSMERRGRTSRVARAPMVGMWKRIGRRQFVCAEVVWLPPLPCGVQGPSQTSDARLPPPPSSERYPAVRVRVRVRVHVHVHVVCHVHVPVCTGCVGNASNDHAKHRSTVRLTSVSDSGPRMGGSNQVRTLELLGSGRLTPGSGSGSGSGPAFASCFRVRCPLAAAVIVVAAFASRAAACRSACQIHPTEAAATAGHTETERTPGHRLV